MKSYRNAARCVFVAATVIAARGQTQIDLRTQGKNIDFSTAASTRPSKTGTSLPASCALGETFLKTDAEAGKNLYVCTASGVWTVQGVAGPSPTGKADQVLSNDGFGLLWQALGGDLRGRPGAVAVTGLSGRKLSSVVPLDGQFLKWNGVMQQWEATTLAGALSVFGRLGAIAAQTGDYSFPQIAGTIAGAQLPVPGGDLNGTLTSARVTGLQSRPVATSMPSIGAVLTWDGAQWAPQAFVSGGVTSLFGRVGAVSAQTGDYSFGQISGAVASAQLPAASGDLSGVLGAATVAGIQNRPVAPTAPGTGQVLAWSGSQWTPQTQSGGSGANSVDKTVSNTYTAGAKQTFAPSLSASGVNVTPGTLPTSPAAGDVAIDSGDANTLKVYDGAQWKTPASGDTSATIHTYTVAGLPLLPIELTVAIASDGNPGCLTGGGTRRVVCQYHSGWSTLGALGDVALVTSVGLPGSNANIVTEKGVRSAIAAVTAAQAGAVADPGGNGLIKRISANVSTPAVAGTDYATATNGSNSQALTSNGAGGFGTSLTLAASATADTTNALNITSGTLPAGRLPNPSASTLGGVQSAAAQMGKLIDSISTAGVPNARALVPADIPNNAANTSGNAATATALAALPGDPTQVYSGAGTWVLQSGGTAASPIFNTLHTGFTAYNNPASSITGNVSYTDYSSQAATVSRGPGLATVTEPMSMNRAIVSVTSAFQVAAGAPAITSLQISLGTATNPTAYMNPLQVGYQLSGAVCAGGVGTFTLASPVSRANQTATVVVSGVVPANYNGTFTPTAWTGTTFNAPVTCAAYVSGGMVGLQGLIFGNFEALPQGISGTNTAYLYLTETNTNPADFLSNLLGGTVRVMLEGVQVQ